MKPITYLAAIALLLACLSGCTTYNYYTAAINKTHLSNYQTFAWMPPGNNAQQAGSEADAKIKDAATYALTSRGLHLTQTNPDLIINYTMTVGRGSRTTYYSPNLGWGGPYWGWGWGYYSRPYYYAGGAPFGYYGAVTYAEREHYHEGTLIIDLIDTRTHKVVWRGFGVGEAQHNQQKEIEDLPKVVNGILNQLKLTPASYK
jgi:Domain of unknown function (DUF4136)